MPKTFLPFPSVENGTGFSIQTQLYDFLDESQNTVGDYGRVNDIFWSPITGNIASMGGYKIIGYKRGIAGTVSTQQDYYFLAGRSYYDDNQTAYVARYLQAWQVINFTPAITSTVIANTHPTIYIFGQEYQIDNFWPGNSSLGPEVTLSRNSTIQSIRSLTITIGEKFELDNGKQIRLQKTTPHSSNGVPYATFEILENNLTLDSTSVNVSQGFYEKNDVRIAVKDINENNSIIDVDASAKTRLKLADLEPITITQDANKSQILFTQRKKAGEVIDAPGNLRLILVSISPYSDYNSPFASFEITQNGARLDFFSMSKSSQTYSKYGLQLTVHDVFVGGGDSSYVDFTVGDGSKSVNQANYDNGWSVRVRAEDFPENLSFMPALKSIELRQAPSDFVSEGGSINMISWPVFARLTFNGRTQVPFDTFNLEALGQRRFFINGSPVEFDAVLLTVGDKFLDVGNGANASQVLIDASENGAFYYAADENQSIYGNSSILKVQTDFVKYTGDFDSNVSRNPLIYHSNDGTLQVEELYGFANHSYYNGHFAIGLPKLESNDTPEVRYYFDTPGIDKVRQLNSGAQVKEGWVSPLGSVLSSDRPGQISINHARTQAYAVYYFTVTP